MARRESAGRRSSAGERGSSFARVSRTSSAVSFLSRTGSSQTAADSAGGSTFKPDRFDLFGTNAPKPRDDSGKTLKQLLKEENLTPSDAKLLMAEYVKKGEFPEETSKRRKRQARLALREPESSERTAEAKKLQALREGGASCQWKGRNDSGKLLICTNSRIRHPRRNDLTFYCGFHQKFCFAVHPAGAAGIEQHNAHGLCSTHYVSKFHRRPPPIGGASAVPGIVALEGRGIRHPMAPEPDSGSDGADSDSSDGPQFEKDIFDKLYSGMRKRQYQATGVPPRDAARAVLRVQSHFRRHVAARIVKRMRHSRYMRERHKAAAMIQMAYRAKRFAQDYPFMQKMTHAAAVTIQRSVRLYLLARGLTRDRIVTQAAVKIQTWYRGIRLRSNFRQMRIRLRARIEGVEKAKARIVVTGLLSRFIARFRRRKDDLRRQRQEDAAECIKRAYRRYVGLKNRHKFRAGIAAQFFHCETVDRIQMAWLASKRRRFGRATRAKYLATILRLQAWVRGCIGRRKARRRRQELESVWRWMGPSLPRSHFAGTIRAPDYNSLFDLERFVKPPGVSAPVSPRAPLAEMIRSRTASVASSRSGEGAAPSSCGEAPARSGEGALSAAGAGFGRSGTERGSGGELAAAPAASGMTASRRAEMREQQEADRSDREAREVEGVIEDARRRFERVDQAGTGLIAPHTFKRVLEEASFPPSAANQLRKRFHEVSSDKVNWHMVIDYAQVLGVRLYSGAAPNLTESAHVYATRREVERTSGAQTAMHMPHLPDQEARLALRRLHGGAMTKAELSKHGKRKAKTAAGTYAFENQPAMLPGIPQPVPGVVGTSVQETIAVVDMPGSDEPAIAVLTDADAYNPETKKRGPQAVRLQQAVLGSFLALASRDVAAMNARARLELTDPDSFTAPRASKRRSSLKAVRQTRNSAAADESAPSWPQSTAAGAIDEYLLALTEGTAGIGPTPATGPFARPRMRGRPLPPRRSAHLQAEASSTSVGSAHAAANEAEARRAAADAATIRAVHTAAAPGSVAQMSLREQHRRRGSGWHEPQARGAASGLQTTPHLLPLTRTRGSRLVASVDSSAVYSELLEELQGPGRDGIDALQQHPPTKIMRLVSSNFAFFRKHWRDLVKALRCGVTWADPDGDASVAPQPERAALFEALARRLGIASSAPTRVQQATAGHGDTPKLTKDTAAAMRPFSLPKLPDAPTALVPASTVPTAAEMEAAFAAKHEGALDPLPSPGSRARHAWTQRKDAGLLADWKEEQQHEASAASAVVIVNAAAPSRLKVAPAPVELDTRSRSALVAAAAFSMEASARLSPPPSNLPSLVWSKDHLRAPPYEPPAPIQLPGCTKHLWLAPSDRCTECRAYRLLPLPQPPCTFHASATIAMARGRGDISVAAQSLTPHYTSQTRSAPHRGPLSVLVVDSQRHSTAPHNPAVLHAHALVQVFALCEDRNGMAWAIGWRLWTLAELRSASSPEVRRCRVNSQHQVVKGRKLVHVMLSATNVVGAGAALRVKTESALKQAARAHKMDPQRCVFYKHTIDAAEEDRLLAAQMLA